MRVLQVTGIVEGHAETKPVQRGARLQFGEKFADVLALCGKLRGARGVARIVTEQMPIVLEIGAAASRIGNNGIDLGALEDVNDFAGEIERRRFFAGVDHERAAAGLRGRSDNFAAFGSKDAHRGGIDVRKKFALHAAEKQTDATARFANGRSDFGNKFGGAESGQECFHRAKFLGKETENA